MIKKEIKFDFDDLLIIPKVQSDIISRSEVNIYNDNMLPLFTAPMDTVVGIDNADIFVENKIIPIIPRGASLHLCNTDTWVAYGLKDYVDFINNPNLDKNKTYRILIDIANGNMKSMHDLIIKGKSVLGDNLILMVGNVANPETYRIVSELGADYCRIGVGNGCFSPNMEVKTNNGLVKICNIKIGDLVYTHTGDLNKVIDVIKYEKNEEILIINDIECTKNHEFYVIDIKYQDIVTEENCKEYAKWIGADKLNKNKHLLIELYDIYPLRLIKIEKIEKKQYDGTVYDLTVENDHSYNINGIIVHNSGCLTSKNVGVGYPMASLIKECYDISCTLDNPAKIVADGGMKNYSDIIKAFGLGCDAVMLGSILNRSLESIGDTYKANVKHVGVETWTEPGDLVDQFSPDVKNAFLNGAKYYKKFRGMSTKGAQKSLGNVILKTSEGVTRMNPVEYTLEGWTENFTHYLASAMSYSGAKNLEDFIGKAEFVQITDSSFNRFNK